MPRNSSPRLSGAVRLRLQGATFTSLEDWRRAQARIPSRSDAVRQLLEQALRDSSANEARQWQSLGDAATKVVKRLRNQD
jgi:hypothetical protein